MQEHLPPELKDMVKELLDSGTYHSFEEIVHEALWLARDRFLLYKVKREELLALLDVGIQQAERGEVAPLDIEAIKAKAALQLQQEQEQEAAPCRK
ncbi:MAG TPA: hypothetical protein VMG10_24055 [Gemmataceae bacterium]|nr:hypothetical protein [Gemmataceae bacterium]